MGEWFNFFMFRNYHQIIIPDIQSTQNLTGDLTHSGKIAHHPKGDFCRST